MGEAISPGSRNDSFSGKQKSTKNAIPVSYGLQLKEDLKLGEEHLLAKQSPSEILIDALKKGEWFKGIILSSAFFEHFGSLRLRNHFRGAISDDKIRNLALGEIIVFLFGLNLLSQKGYSKIIRVKEKRDDLAHYPFTKIDPKEAEQLILDALECLKELEAG